MKKFSLVVLLGLSLFLLWCWNQETNDEEHNNQPDEQQQNVSKSESDFDMSECMKWCEMMRNKEWLEEKMFGDCKSLCTAGKAMEEGDASGCEDSEWIMKDSCYSSVAHETLNPNICEKVTDGMIRYGCYASIAEEKKDDSICNKIEDKMFKAACIDSVKAE